MEHSVLCIWLRHGHWLTRQKMHFLHRKYGNNYINSDVCTAENVYFITCMWSISQHYNALTNQNHITKINQNLAASVSVRLIIRFKYLKEQSWNGTLYRSKWKLYHSCKTTKCLAVHCWEKQTTNKQHDFSNAHLVQVLDPKLT